MGVTNIDGAWLWTSMDPKKVFQLDLHGKKLTRIEGLEKFKLLRTLDVSCNRIRKLHGLENNKDLRELKVYGNEIKVIEDLDRLTEVCTLLLQHNKISCIGKGLSNLKKLRQLRLDHNSLETVSSSELTSCGAYLTQLDLSHNKLANIQGLGSLSNLEELKLASNRLTSPPGLSRCRKLQELDLSDNPIKAESLIDTLNCLQQLKILHLGSLHLNSVSCLPKFQSLQELHLPHNHLTRLEGLSRVSPSLEALDVSWNELPSVEGLICLGDLCSFCEIQMEGNPVCKSSDNYRNEVHGLLPNLEVIDGVGSSLLPSTSLPTFQMRPLTPSSLGPTLRQMEHQFFEAELQLDGMEGEMTAMFELTRAKMVATLRERDEDIREGETTVAFREGTREMAGKRLSDSSENGRKHSPSDQVTKLSANNEIGGEDLKPDSVTDVNPPSIEHLEPGSVGHNSTGKAESRTPSVLKELVCIESVHGDASHSNTNRPPTRSGSRAKLTEALEFATVYQ